ncbi:hypothetical protein OIU84_003070 [Salix udensis]|uniref:Uncharacterized protein n=1 Tax=Salix udensis TaxID=889485 RepID=A0AAD6P584_9ROSI|nr:hypothetical protein OIU84_003070 [Salix udensis]
MRKTNRWAAVVDRRQGSWLNEGWSEAVGDVVMEAWRGRGKEIVGLLVADGVQRGKGFLEWTGE